LRRKRGSLSVEAAEAALAQDEAETEAEAGLRFSIVTGDFPKKPAHKTTARFNTQ
jgi:hypothetical protein